MTSTNPRTAGFPKNSVLMVPDTSGIIPIGYTQESSLNCKFIKGIATVCSNPGDSVGAATHTHCSAGGHTHTNSGSTAHTHTGGTTGPSATSNHTDTNSIGASAGHTHTVTSTSASPTVSLTCDGSHTHDAQNNLPEHRTVAFYKKTETSVGLRRKAMPLNTMIFFAGSIVPSGYVECSSYHSKHIRGASTSGTNAGTNTHTHSSVTHTHPATIASHSHSGTTHSGSSSGTSRNLGGMQASVAANCHSHTAGSYSFNTACGSVTSSTSGAHTHDTVNIEPSYKTLNLIKNSTIKLRRPAIEKDFVSLWVCPVACIPQNYAVSDGNNCTINLLGLYPKGSCTPNNTGGSNTHTHNCVGPSHTHTATVNHTHSLSGTTGASSATSTVQNCSSSSSNAAHPHTHNASGSSSNSGPAITSDASDPTHNHGSKNHEPVGVTVAFIQRV